MRITIDRAWKKPNYTISRVFINGERFGDGKNWCSMLEDTDRGLNDSMTVDEILKKKIPNKTAIPRGVYLLTITYSPRFKKNLILVNNVKGYSGVRIHAGNTDGDSSGCLLPGVNDKVGRVSNSRYWVEKIQAIVKETLNKGERVYLEIK